MSSQWVDANGNEWRFSAIAGNWQAKINGSWRVTPLPSGGLRRTTADNVSPGVVIVETMGPQGPAGEDGPPGLTYVSVSEVLSAQLQNGVNSTFSFSETADLTKDIKVFRNGLMETPGQGYLVTGNAVTFTTPPLDSDVIAVVYQKAQ